MPENVKVVRNDDEQVLYFGDWTAVGSGSIGSSTARYSACEFSFRGPSIRWFGPEDGAQGRADVYLDGEFQRTVDGYSPTPRSEVVRFERSDLTDDRIHTIRIVVQGRAHPDAVDVRTGVDFFEAVTPLHYPTEIARLKDEEYRLIRSGIKPFLPPEEWVPVPDRASTPERGVVLGAGVFWEMFERNLTYLNYCFSQEGYCNTDFPPPFENYGGPGWSRWLPASNEGRMLVGAANSLRWGERADMRTVVGTVVDDIAERMREDGYYGYYPESDSYALGRDNPDGERKNYDRVLWTRGLLSAGLVGDPRGYDLARRMSDWFNASRYLPNMLDGPNATNGFPGGPMMHLSPVGNANDLIVTKRYYDQDYWMAELTNREPLSFTYYPGDRPHCYDLLGLDAMLDEYRATGESKYIDAVVGGWAAYRDNFKHVGGATALCEEGGPYPPKSFYITTGHTGETCGSVFWINVNSKLLQLYPDQEVYAGEIEESLLNVLAASQDARGFIRYHNRLHGTKDVAKCSNTCCEVSAAGLFGRLPELIYSLDEQGVYVNLYATSTLSWGEGRSLAMTSDFPNDMRVSIAVATPKSQAFIVRVRIPSWATEPVTVQVNGSDWDIGEPGTFLPLDRTWTDQDLITFTLPAGFRTVEYTGLDRVEGDESRYALMYGPVLMALGGDSSEADGVSRLSIGSEDLSNRLIPSERAPLEFDVEDHPGYRYVPYWKIDSERFTCFPILAS